MASNLRQWQKRLEAMQNCSDVAEMLAQHGPPPHKVQQNGFEIWHYPLGMESGMVYSIHVSVWSDQTRQVYLYFEPASEHLLIRRHSWWQFWKK